MYSIAVKLLPTIQEKAPIFMGGMIPDPPSIAHGYTTLQSEYVFVKLSYMMALVILKSRYLILVLPDVIVCLGLGVVFVFT